MLIHWFASTYTIPRSNTVRTHRIEWQGWTERPMSKRRTTSRWTFSFYHWGPWLQKPDGTWPHGYITGSGLPMKFVRTDGTLTSVYQQLTEMADDQLFADQGGLEGLTGAQAVALSQSLIDASLAGNYSALTDIHHVDNYGSELSRTPLADGGHRLCAQQGCAGVECRPVAEFHADRATMPTSPTLPGTPAPGS